MSRFRVKWLVAAGDFRILLLLTATPLAVEAQGEQAPVEAVPAIPYHAPAKTAGRDSAVEALPLSHRMAFPAPPVFSLPPLSVAERSRKIKPGSRSIGMTRDVAAEALRAGQCTTLPDGTSVWRLEIHSPGAISLRLHLLEFDLPGGALWLSSAGHSPQFFGPYSGRGTYDDGDFWTNTVDSDTALLTLERKAGCDAPLPFVIKEVAHRWRPDAFPAERRAAGEVGACQEKFGCAASDAQWRQLANSVVKISTVSLSGEITPDCTGTLIRTRSGQGPAYVLSAGHCFSDSTAANRSLEFRWFNQLSSCSPQTESLGRRTLGARIVRERDFRLGGDYFLFVLIEPPPTGAIAAGWDPNLPAPSASVTSIHHPAGSFQHISEGVRFGLDTGPITIVDGYGYTVGTMAPQTYLKAMWSRGATEPGSSGAPLFTSSTAGALVGTLTAGQGCESSTPTSTYARFSVTYQDIRSVLEDCTVAVAGNNLFASPSGVQGSYTVTTSFSNCRWTAKSTVNWIQLMDSDLSPLYPQVAGSDRVANGNGSVQYNVMPNLTSSPRIGALIVAGQTFYVSQGPLTPLQTFGDVPASHLFADHIHLLTSMGSRASGCAAGNFCPDIPTTRAMMAEFIVRFLFGETFPSSQVPVFPDVPSNHPSFRYVQKLRETSITLGCGDGSLYCPNDPVTREQMAAFIVRAMMVRNGRPALDDFQFSPTGYFSDVPSTSTFFRYIQRMKEMGITSGATNTTYGPKDLNSRGQIAVFLVRSSVAP